MKICIISPSFPDMRCGIGDYTWRFAQYLQAPDREVFLITSDNAKIREYLNQNNIGWIKVFPIVKRWGFFSIPQIIKKIKDVNPDVLHIQYQWWAYQKLSMITFLPLLLKTKRKNFLVVSTLHDLMGPYFFPKATMLRRMALKNMAFYSDRTTVIDKVDEACLKRMVPMAAGRIRYIPIGANVLPQRAQLEKDNRSVVTICNYGYLFPYKGVDTLLDSLKILKDTGYKVRLILIGGDSIENSAYNDYPNHIRDLISKKGLSTLVELLGYCKPEEASLRLADCDICALPFHDGVQERRGTFITAMAHRLPIITTLGDRTPKEFKDGEDVIFVPARNPLMLAQALSRLIDDPGLRSRLSQSSYRLYRERYTWEHIAQETVRLYYSGLGH